MPLSQKLEFRQSQALVMTPQLMQAIKLLQLSHLDLAAYVEGELERNPLLERVDDGAELASSGHDSDGGPVEPSASIGDHAGDGGDAADWLGEHRTDSRAEIESRLDTDLGNVFPDDAAAPPTAPARAEPIGLGSWTGVGPGGREDGAADLESYVPAEVSLAEHLAAQLALAVADPRRRLVGRHIIDLVDDAGYIQGDLGSIAEKLGCPLAEVEAVLAIVQRFEPSGVCARSLAECLAIQLIERDRYDPAMRALVGHLELLAKRDFAALRRVCGVDDDDLADMVDEIRRLDPKPGLAFGSTVVQPVVPDVFVRPSTDGGWAVELNPDTLPRVLVNQTYFATVSRTTRGEHEKAYLAECLQSATWLARSLDQRARTILKVASEIVRQQDGFLTHGVAHLRPLNLRHVADAIGMHESTVSRVTSNKYMATPRGILEMKYFFTSAIAASDGGEAHSAEAVRHRIRQMIMAEEADDVLSDDTIVDRLRAVGIDIARRTVAKYREGMRIPSSVQRRREKLMLRQAGEG